MKNSFWVQTLLATSLLSSACERNPDVQHALTITQITPGMTYIGGTSLNTAMRGDTLTIQGQFFSSVAAENHVMVQGVATPVLTATDTALTAVVPATTPFAYVLVQVARDGYQSAEQQISVRSVPSPVLTGLRPLQGPVGTLVTIYGRNLLSTLESHLMTFSDPSGGAAPVVVPFTPILATADSLQVRIPVGAGTGKITLYARAAENNESGFGGMVTPVFTVTP